MKQILFSTLVIFTFSLAPRICLAQADTSKAIGPVDGPKTDSALVKKEAAIVDTAAVAKSDSAVVIGTPMNCYKQWLDCFAERTVKPLTDGVQEVVIAFKSKESCHCYMGKVELIGGKIKSPVLIQTEGGDYKSFAALGKKLDPDFVSVQGDALWQVTNGMSVLFTTSEQEYGRIFFYKMLNKNKQANKEAPSPADLLK